MARVGRERVQNAALLAYAVRVVERVVEPELMDDPAQAEAYARADFEGPNALFCERLAHQPLPEGAHVLDLGCGPADIPIRLAAERPGQHFWAVDGAAAMLDHARKRLSATGLGGRVTLVHGRLGALSLPERSFDVVLSNSLLHHLHDPSLLWREVAVRGRPGAWVQIMDLRRPPDAGSADAIVARYAGDEPPILRRDFAASLRAAFTPGEVMAQLRAAGLSLSVSVPSDRHLMVTGHL